MPVFNFVKNEYINQGKDVSKIDFKNWIKDDLDIDFEKGTSILYVKYKNQNKNFIIEVLDMISRKYKDYSKKEQQKTLTNTRKYLEEQKKIMETKSNNSQKVFNKFSIENGLGNIDGFIGLSNLNKSLSGNELSSIANNLRNNNNSLFKRSLKGFSEKEEIAGQRYKNQFSQLEAYEAQYVNLSSKLRPNTEVLKELKIKIDNLKDSLKRPNEILLKFKNLSKIAKRDEALLSQVSESLEIVKLELNRIPDAWELISTPQIHKNKIFPNKKNILLITFLISSLIGSLISYFIEKSKGIIYDFDYIFKNIALDYIYTLDKKDIEINKIFIQKFIKKDNVLSIVKLDKNLELNFLYDLFSKKELIEIDFKYLSNNFEKFDNFIFIIQAGKVTYEDLNKINNYSIILGDKIKGWIFLEN